MSKSFYDERKRCDIGSEVFSHLRCSKVEIVHLNVRNYLKSSFVDLESDKVVIKSALSPSKKFLHISLLFDFSSFLGNFVSAACRRVMIFEVQDLTNSARLQRCPGWNLI